MSKQLTIGTRIDHAKYGEGIISKVNLTSYEVFLLRGGKMEFSKSSEDIDVLELAPDNGSGAETSASGIDVDDLEKMIVFVLDRYAALQENVPLGEKWQGGKMVLHPANPAQAVKEIPMEVFFHKIVMLRDRLRVLEQNINSNEKLNDEEKVNLQQYITRIYGSLTTFNILFSEKDHYFVGAASK
jgi:hypothetical protein